MPHHKVAHRTETRDYPDMRERVRTACATLRDAVGSNGPESIESFAERAAARIVELEARLERVREMVSRLNNFEPKQDFLDVINGGAP